MKRLIFSLFCILLALSGFAQEYSYKNLAVDYQVQNSEKMSFTYKNLRLYPIRAKADFYKNRPYIGKYTPLREALADKRIIITETESATAQTNLTNNPNQRVRTRERNETQSQETRVDVPNLENQEIQTQQIEQRINNSATVNTLFIENTSKDTVYIMAGEIVQGGKQDRVIAQDLLLPPNSGQINLSVFCVEQGRWTYGRNENDDKSFNKYYGVPSMQLRGVVEKKQNQSEVWKEVARANEKNKVSTATGAYTAQSKTTDFQKLQEEYINYFKDKFQNEADIVGVVIVTANRVVGCDLFATNDLFKSQFSNLLGSYVNEAITDGDKVVIQQTEVEKYMDNLLKDERKQEEFIQQKGKKFEVGSKKLHISTFH
jgi:hypothetical protein